MTTPRWLRALLGWIVHPDDVDAVLGDLEELHRERLRTSGWARASLGTAREGLGIAVSELVDRLRSGISAGVSSPSDVRLALRRLGKTPLLTTSAFLSLATGVALAATGFSVVVALANPGLPFEGGERVVKIDAIPQPDADFVEPLGPSDLLRAADAATLLTDVGVVEEGPENLRTVGGDVQLVTVARISPGAFDYAHPVPAAGRPLGVKDAHGAVVSLRFWEARGRDPGLVGEELELAGSRYTVVGVLAEEATFPTSADVVVPLPPDDEREPEPGWTRVLHARLVGTATPEQAEDQLGGLLASEGVDVRVSRVGEVDTSAEGSVAVGLLVAFLVVIAGNVGNLMVAKASALRSELAVRAALGASRVRLVSQLSAEAAVVAVAATGVGLAVSRSLLGWFEASEPGAVPPWYDLGPGPATLLFVVLAALGITVVAGVVPAWRATGGRFAELGGRGPTARPFTLFHDALIVLQVALAVGIVGGASMVSAGWSSAGLGRDLGVRTDRIATAQVDLPDDVRGTRTALREAMMRLEGVEAVTFASSVPGGDAPMRRVILDDGGSGSDPEAVPVATIASGFLDVMGVSVVAGRSPLDSDHAPDAPPVAWVNDLFVEGRLGGANPIGRRVAIAPAGDAAPRWHEIVGVMPDLGLSGADVETAGGVYLPMAGESEARLLVRTSRDPTPLLPLLTSAAYEVDPEITLVGLFSLEDLHGRLRRVYLAVGGVLTALGALVLGLSLMGIFAVLSADVTRRTREIGVRVALGATAPDVLRPTLLRVAAYVGLGATLGAVFGSGLVELAAATFVMRFPATGPGTFVLLACVVGVVALLSAAFPTRRALAIHPMEALRAD